MTMATLVTKLGNAVNRAAKNTASGGWYSPLMASASRPILERIPLVDLVVEVRDARIPFSSKYEELQVYPSSSKRIIVLNKIDLANWSQTKEWFRYFEQQNCIYHGVNSHNKESVEKFLNFLQASVRESKKDHTRYTKTIMLVGIPNVGKSALANSLHQIGRVSAAEKGKFKRVTVSPTPGETKEISSLKIGSHPNIYLLDTPSVLPSRIPKFDICAKLVLTGAIEDCLAGEKELAEYFLSILSLSDQYKKWAMLPAYTNDGATIEHKEEPSRAPNLGMKKRRQDLTDHTQDYIVNKVRRTLFEAVSSFNGKIEKESDLTSLANAQFAALHEVLHVPIELGEDAQNKVAAKILNLYRTGRLGHYTLDPVPTNNPMSLRMVN